MVKEMYHNYSFDERVLKIEGAREILHYFNDLRRNNKRMTVIKAYSLTKIKFGEHCPTLQTIYRWKHKINLPLNKF